MDEDYWFGTHSHECIPQLILTSTAYLQVGRLRAQRNGWLHDVVIGAKE